MIQFLNICISCRQFGYIRKSLVVNNESVAWMTTGDSFVFLAFELIILSSCDMVWAGDTSILLCITFYSCNFPWIAYNLDLILRRHISIRCPVHHYHPAVFELCEIRIFLWSKNKESMRLSKHSKRASSFEWSGLKNLMRARSY